MIKNITFTLEYEQKSITLPVNPSDIEVTSPADNEETEVIGLGAIIIPRQPGLREVEIKSFFPEDKNPATYNTFITDWRTSRKPGKLTISGLNISLTVVAEDYNVTRSSGIEGDYYYDLTLKEYRAYGAKVVEIKADAPAETPVAVAPEPERVDTSPPTPRTYTVVKGDCLWNIAKKYTGSGSRWPELYDLNKSTIGGNANLIYPGQVYTLPTSW